MGKITFCYIVFNMKEFRNCCGSKSAEVESISTPHTSGSDGLTDDLPTCRTGQTSPPSRPVDFVRRARQTAKAINNPLVALKAPADKLN